MFYDMLEFRKGSTTTDQFYPPKCEVFFLSRLFPERKIYTYSITCDTTEEKIKFRGNKHF